MIINKTTWLAAIMVLGTTQAHAKQNSPAQENAELEKYQSIVQQLSNQNIIVKSVADSPFIGIKEVVLTTGTQQQIVYLSEDGEYLFEGNLMDIKNKQNLTEMTRSSLRQELMNEFKKTHKSIDFLPEQMTDHITVFTDIDCGYCRKLHQEVDQYNELGIGVSYLFFPRNGLNTPAHQKAVNVWCASDQQAAMTTAKNGTDLPPLMCPNPIELQYNLGIGAGVHKVGTPAVVFADGSMVPGYLPAERMRQKLDQIKQKSSK